MHTRIFTHSPQYTYAGVMWSPARWGNVGIGGGGVLLSALETICCALIYPTLRHGPQSPLTHNCAWRCGGKNNYSLPSSHHAGIRGSRGIDPLIRNIGTRWWSVLAALPPRNNPGNHGIWVWVGLRGGLDILENRNISCLRRDSIPGSSTPQSSLYESTAYVVLNAQRCLWYWT